MRASLKHDASLARAGEEQSIACVISGPGVFILVLERDIVFCSDHRWQHPRDHAARAIAESGITASIHIGRIAGYSEPTLAGVESPSAKIARFKAAVRNEVHRGVGGPTECEAQAAKS